MAKDNTSDTPQTGIPHGAAAGVIAETGRTMLTAEEYQATVEEEYGDWVAAEPILYNGALAYNTGDPIPASNVTAHGYDQTRQAVRRSTRAGGDAQATQVV